jgi:hypothetical protein
MLHSKLVSAVAHCLRTVIRVSLDLACVPVLAVRSHNALALALRTSFFANNWRCFRSGRPSPTALTTPPAG